MTAEITLMPDEDPRRLSTVREWVRDFGPKSDEECFYAERAAYLSWQVQRNFRAQSARLTRRAQTALNRKQRRQERKASELATQLFQMPIGSLSGNAEIQGDAAAQTTKVRSGLVSGQINAGEGDQPGPIVQELESTVAAGGCWPVAEALGGGTRGRRFAWKRAAEQVQAIPAGGEAESTSICSTRSIAADPSTLPGEIEPELGDLVGEYWNEASGLPAGLDHGGIAALDARRSGTPTDAARNAEAELEENREGQQCEQLEAVIKDRDERDELEARVFFARRRAFDPPDDPAGEQMKRYGAKGMPRYVDRFTQRGSSSRLAERRQTGGPGASRRWRVGRDGGFRKWARRRGPRPAIDRGSRWLRPRSGSLGAKSGPVAAAEHKRSQRRGRADRRVNRSRKRPMPPAVTPIVRNEPPQMQSQAGAKAKPLARDGRAGWPMQRRSCEAKPKAAAGARAAWGEPGREGGRPNSRQAKAGGRRSSRRMGRA